MTLLKWKSGHVLLAPNPPVASHLTQSEMEGTYNVCPPSVLPCPPLLTPSSFTWLWPLWTSKAVPWMLPNTFTPQVLHLPLYLPVTFLSQLSMLLPSLPSGLCSYYIYKSEPPPLTHPQVSSIPVPCCILLQSTYHPWHIICLLSVSTFQNINSTGTFVYFAYCCIGSGYNNVWDIISTR